MQLIAAQIGFYQLQQILRRAEIFPWEASSLNPTTQTFSDWYRNPTRTFLTVELGKWRPAGSLGPLTDWLIVRPQPPERRQPDGLLARRAKLTLEHRAKTLTGDSNNNIPGGGAPSNSFWEPSESKYSQWRHLQRGKSPEAGLQPTHWLVSSPDVTKTLTSRSIVGQQSPPTASDLH